MMNLNFCDDQFDLSDTAISVAVGLLAGHPLVQKRWRFYPPFLVLSWG
ncbi:MAG: hypothetical protein ACOYK8_01750 [Alphaproteobacteria bacterium]